MIRKLIFIAKSVRILEKQMKLYTFLSKQPHLDMPGYANECYRSEV